MSTQNRAAFDSVYSQAPHKIVHSLSGRDANLSRPSLYHVAYLMILVLVTVTGCQPIPACADASCSSIATPLSTGTAHAQPRPSVYAFVDINVIPMDHEAVLRHQTVLVVGDRIAALGPVKRIAIPSDATLVPSTGYYLLPGLADMHVHLRAEAYLTLLLANGVTTVRNMDGRPEHLTWREEIANGERIGPRICTTGPILDELPPHLPDDRAVDTPEGARRIVRAQKDLGYDAIKVYDGLTPSTYSNIVDAAHAAGMDVVGHVPDRVSIFNVIAAGQRSIEHLDGYFGVYPDQLPDLVAATVEQGVWNTPTLIMLQRFEAVGSGANSNQTTIQQAILRYLPESVLRTWWLPSDFSAVGYVYGSANRSDLALVYRLHQAGAPLLLGTDAPMPCALPGFAVHQELRNMVDAGLTPYEALRTATYNPALFLGQLEQLGTVTVGKRADLLILAANPLLDIGNSSQIVGVMAQGQWWPESRLAELLADY